MLHVVNLAKLQLPGRILGRPRLVHLVKITKARGGGGEMALRLKAPAALPGDLGWVQFICYSSSTCSGTLFWPLWSLGMFMCTGYTCRQQSYM